MTLVPTWQMSVEQTTDFEETLIVKMEAKSIVKKVNNLLVNRLSAREKKERRKERKRETASRERTCGKKP